MLPAKGPLKGKIQLWYVLLKPLSSHPFIRKWFEQGTCPKQGERVDVVRARARITDQSGIQVAETAVELFEEQEVTLIMQNYRKEPVELTEDHLLGVAQKAEEVVTGRGAKTGTPEVRNQQ